MPSEYTGASGIVEVDVTAPDHPIVYVSPGFERLTGYAAAEVLGRNCRLLQGPDTDPRTAAVLAEAIRDGREADVTILNYRADGVPFWNELTVAPHRVRDGRVTRYLGVQKDVTERVAAGARIHRLAHFDHLTGLPNRATLHDELRSALHRARVHDLQVALLAIDLDDFKRVNDRHGHHVGNALLRAVGERLLGVVRPSDVLARQGVDEVAAFGVGLPDEPPPGVRGAQLDADDAVRSAAGRGSRRRTAMPLRGGARTMPGAAGEAAGREGEGDRGAGRPRPRVARHEGRPNGRATTCPARRGGEGPAPLHGRARARGCPGATRGWGARRAGCAACRPGLAARA